MHCALGAVSGPTGKKDGLCSDIACCPKLKVEEWATSHGPCEAQNDTECKRMRIICLVMTNPRALEFKVTSQGGVVLRRIAWMCRRNPFWFLRRGPHVGHERERGAIANSDDTRRSV